MTIRLVTGPPGAGKTTYTKEHAKDGDTVLDLDVLREQYGEAAKDVRKTLEEHVQSLPGDVWVIRTLADAQARTEATERLNASEVIVLETPADVCKQRLLERESDEAKRAELSSAVDNWWNQYGVVESNLIVKPDTGSSSVKEKPMGNTQEQEERGFPADTKLEDMDDKQQAAYWKYHSRKHESEKNRLQQQLEAKSSTPKADEQKTPGDNPQAPTLDIASIKAEIKKEIRLEEAPGKVAKAFKDAVGMRMEEAKLEEFLGDLDLTKFVKDDGSIDTDKIRTRAELLAPRPEVRTHLGNRREASTTPSSVQKGRELFDNFNKK